MNLCFYCMNPIDSPEAICPHCGHDNHNRDNGPGLLSGGTLAGKYAVGRLLGRGGFGATYMGFDTFLQRRVAIKEYFPTNLVMRDGNSSSLSVISGGAESFVKGREKALQESRMASSLGSIPGIVQTYDVFAANNTIYIVMEYVEGDTLTGYVAKQPEKLSVSRAMELLEQVVTALSTLHRRKVIHRDVKPDNIMIRNDPEQGVLLDFGAAKVDDGSTLGNSSAVVSPGYAPPEQYNATSLDGRIDQYALAATMYFVLTGQRPPDVMMRVVDDGALKPMQEYNPAISPRVDEVIRKAMSIKADERYGTITEFWDSLKAALSGRSKPVTAPVKKTEKKPRKAKWLPAALAAVVVLGVGLFAALGGFSCKHDWREATCTAPVTCALCGAVEGEALGHSWKEATCTAPVTCTLCGAVEGEALGHSWKEATCAVPKTCTVCALTEGTAPGHVWEAADADTPRTCTVCKAEMPVTLLVAGEFHTVCINPDGTVSATGYNDFDQCNLEGWTDVVQVAAGTNHTVGLKADGTVVAQGQNQYGQCNVGDWTDVVRIYADTDHTLGIRSDGTVYATGYNHYGECDLSHWTDIVDVAGGFVHTVGLKKDGTVVAAGSNEFRQLNVEEWTDIVDVATGDFYTVGLKKDGTIVFTGRSEYNQRDHVSGWTDIVAIDGKHQNIVGLKADGTLVFGGQGYYGEEENQPEWKDIIALAPGDFHMAALKSDGTVIAYGENRYGQLNVEDWKLETAAITQKPVQAESDIVPLENANVGDYVIYGHYERDGEENLEWLVLDKKDGKLLLLSRYALAAEPFNTEYTDVTWQTSTLRNWINHDLMVDIIHDEDMRWIVMENAEAHDNAVYGTDAGNDASNHLFLLSAEEVQRYLPTEESRMCKPSPYSEQETWTDDQGCCYWWLRTPGAKQSHAVYINGEGVIDYYGGTVEGTSVAVRPAMWVEVPGMEHTASPIPVVEPNNSPVALEEANVGDYVIFGRYEQDGNFQNGSEDVEWLVLDKQDDKLLVVSRYGLDRQPYHHENTPVTWNASSLRFWLNNDFLNAAFTGGERSRIFMKEAPAHENPLYPTDSGLIVKDYVFLLSAYEAEGFFFSNEARSCKPTAYAISNGVWVDETGSSYWWLRTPGKTQDYASEVLPQGYVDCSGFEVSWTNFAVRPAMWIEISSGEETEPKNNEGELATGQQTKVISAGYEHTVGLKPDGTVVAVGSNFYGQCDVADWTNIIQVSAGNDHTVGLKFNGTVQAVGWNNYGQCDVSDWTDIIQVSAGKYHTVGLKFDGTVVAAGSNDRGQCDVSDWTDIVQVDTGYLHTVGLKSDGTVVSVGSNTWDRADVTEWSGIEHISSKSTYTVGLKSDGTVVTTGTAPFNLNSITSWTNIIQISAEEEYIVGLKSDGTVVKEGTSKYGLNNVSNWSDIVQITSGALHVIGLKSDGTLVATGKNDAGQCNVTDWEIKEETSLVPVALGEAGVGDYVLFGKYEQDGDEANGKEDIQWLVLDKQDDRVLVISRYGLDCQLFFPENASVTWETSTLRTWLNQDFLNAAFTGDERDHIPTVTVEAQINPRFASEPGNNTQDKVFLLSLQEVENYFAGAESRKCTPTAYALSQNSVMANETGFCYWWLRSPGYVPQSVGEVSDLGETDHSSSPNNGGRAVRPAMWISLTPVEPEPAQQPEPEAESPSFENLFFGKLEQAEVAEGAVVEELEADNPFDAASVGDYVLFGKYEQDGDEANGQEEIEWLVLDKQDDRMLVISRYGLDCQPYNTSYENVTWETSTLRSWLNNNFMNNAFSQPEQEKLLPTELAAPDNATYGTDAGNPTVDRVFLLSVPEVKQYLPTDESRMCKSTAYADGKGAILYSNGMCWWSLRSPGQDHGLAAFVKDDGRVGELGVFVHIGDGAIRPAMWISLKP